MQIPIVNGSGTDRGADLRSSYPVNLIPVPKQSGISHGYLRTADGMVEFANSIYSDSYDRGAINYKDQCFRVIGDWLTRVNEDQTIDYLGEIENDGKRAVIVQDFDGLAIAAAGRLYYYPVSGGVSYVTDPDLGTVLDVISIGGYRMTTDGNSLVVTELNDKFAVNPLKYGSSEVLPDKINSLLNVRNEAIAVNRYSCEFFQNVGGNGFPFQRIEGAMIPKGSVGTHASCYFLDSFAFVGSGQNEAISVYIGAQGTAAKIATREIEQILSEYTEPEVFSVIVESQEDLSHQFLFIHLPDRTLVYDHAGSQAAGEPLWHIRTSGPTGELPYRARNYCRAYGKWLFGDLQSVKIGYFTHEDARQFGETTPWQFDTGFMYAEGRGAIIHDLELVRLPGRETVSNASTPATGPAYVWLRYTEDGIEWSQPRSSGAMVPGRRHMRTAWRTIRMRANYLGLRVEGRNNPYPDAFLRLEARVEPLFA